MWISQNTSKIVYWLIVNLTIVSGLILKLTSSSFLLGVQTLLYGHTLEGSEENPP